jgi:glycosyltransferase involved in cell wall biosynthesis
MSTISKREIDLLHCAETIKGGIATYLRDLLVCQARDLDPRRIAVVIPRSQVEDLPVPEGVQVYTFNDNAGRATNAFRLGFMVARLARAHRVKVTHAHSTFAGATVRPLLAMHGQKQRIIYCPHGWAWDRQTSVLAKKATQWVERALSGYCAKVICISEHEFKAGVDAGVPSHQLQLIVNGVLEQAPPAGGRAPEWPEGKKRLLFVGRFDRQKGVDLFCAALEQLGEEAFGMLAGGAVLEDAEQVSPPSNVKLLGWIDTPRLQSLLETADVLVVPSRWEGFGLIAAEAMRAGLPVIAARVGGLPEIVADQETGLLFEPGDVNGIVAAVRRYSRDEWQVKGQAGKERFERLFTMERVHGQLLEQYRQSGFNHTPKLHQISPMPDGSRTSRSMLDPHIQKTGTGR